MLALEASGFGKSQLVILDNEAYPGSSVIDVDSQTKRISVSLDGDMLSISAPGSISLLGLALLKDTSVLGYDATPKSSQFSLDLYIGESVSRTLRCPPYLSSYNLSGHSFARFSLLFDFKCQPTSLPSIVPSLTSQLSTMSPSMESKNNIPSSSPSAPAPSSLPSGVPSKTNTYEPTRKPVPEFMYTSPDTLDKPVSSRLIKDLEYCPCDSNNICLEKSRLSLTVTNRAIRICLQAIPSDAKLSISAKTIHNLASLNDPMLEISGYEGNENSAVISTELQPDFFVANNPGEITVYGTGEILAPGSRSRGQAAFFIIYDLLSTSESPTLSPTGTDPPTSELLLGAKACLCEQETTVCSEEFPYVSYASRVFQVCIL